MLTWNSNDYEQMEKRYRANFFNSLTGFKAGVLIGTVNEVGQTNLAIFTSAVHIGANPPLIGLIVRPTTAPRHTYENIKATGFYTLNQIHADFFEQAHHTAARYGADVSEFEATGLTPAYTDTHPAPYVAESTVKHGLEFAEEQPIEINGTILLIGRVIETVMTADFVQPDGFVDLEAAGSVTVSGLDSYHKTERLARLPYAKPKDVTQHDFA